MPPTLPSPVSNTDCGRFCSLQARRPDTRLCEEGGMGEGKKKSKGVKSKDDDTVVGGIAWVEMGNGKTKKKRLDRQHRVRQSTFEVDIWQIIFVPGDGSRVKSDKEELREMGPTASMCRILR
jgi:hypothetical protein